MNACQQPGCTGTITEGYCDVCGMPPVATPAALPPTAGPAQAGKTVQAEGTASPRGGGACGLPGCAGTITDGYCDVCGSPAPESGDSPAATDASASGPISSSSSSSSTRLGSAALGSKRLGGSTSATRRTRSGTSRTRAARLGAGLTTVPPAPPVDAAQAVLTNPQVPENKRNCAKCGAPVGRSQGDRPGRPEGFCPKCGEPYSFTPKLGAGDLVAGQYLVAGALAHGGLGWIYLARDRNVSDRWVVLKGLLNSGDPDALAAAIAEQRFLAQVEHPLIVEIYNFVTHEGAGYIVMEYVGGTSLKQVLKNRMRDSSGVYEPLAVDQALAYIVEILPAFQYLHDLGLVYCDFKPDNLIQVGDAVKLIDLGGVRRVDDEDSAIYGTVGYQAPEVAEVGPTVASDIYTIGRTIVVLTMEFRGYQGSYLHSLPDPATAPVFAAHDSFYQLVAKCCAPDPADRFVSADELRGQMLGVLREVVAATTTGTALTSAASLNFAAPAVAAARLSWNQLPELRADPSDPQYSWLSSLAPGPPKERLALLETAPEDSAEVWLARGIESLRDDDPPNSERASSQLLKADPWEWRALWLSGLAYLKTERWTFAQQAFNAVYQQVPGELAPKLALAIACESGGEPGVAEGLYRTCAETDAAYVAPAAFGMARIRAARGDVQGAVEALDMVPSTSRGFGESRRLRAETLIGAGGGSLATLDQALRSVDGVQLQPQDRAWLTARILERAVELADQGDTSAASVGPYAAHEPQLRSGLESQYRLLARGEADRERRIHLVNRANAVREWSMT